MAETVDLVVVGFLLGIVADADDGFFGGDHRAGLPGGDFKFSVAGGDYADDGLAVLESEMEGLCGDDGGDGVPLEIDVAGKVGFQQQRFGIGLDDGSGQSVAVFERNLIGF